MEGVEFLFNAGTFAIPIYGLIAAAAQLTIYER